MVIHAFLALLFQLVVDLFSFVSMGQRVILVAFTVLFDRLELLLVLLAQTKGFERRTYYCRLHIVSRFVSTNLGPFIN